MALHRASSATQAKAAASPGNDAADAQEPAAHEPDELVGRLVHGPPEEGAEIDDHEAEQQEHPPDARRADPGLAERHGKEELEQAHGHKGAGEDVAQQHRQREADNQPVGAAAGHVDGRCSFFLCHKFLPLLKKYTFSPLCKKTKRDGGKTCHPHYVYYMG